MSAPQILVRHVDDLLPYTRNSRTHPPGQVADIAASIDQFGMVGAIIVRQGVIAKGHGTLEAIKALYARGALVYPAPGQHVEPALRPKPYPAGTVPVLDASAWSDAQFRAYVIADNRIAEDAGWDEDILRLEVQDLAAEGFDLELTGLDTEQLDELLAEVESPAAEGGADPDKVPDERNGGPVSRLWDVWQMGPHRLVVGDARDPGVWDLLMQGEVADAAWTDPPYQVDLDTKNRRMDEAVGGNRSGKSGIANDRMSDADFGALLRDSLSQLAQAMKPGASAYVAHSDKAGRLFREAFDAAGLRFHQNVVWRKNVHVMGFAKHLPIHEPLAFVYRPGSRQRWYGGRGQTTVVDWGQGGPVRRLEDGRWAIQAGDAVLIVSGEATLEEVPGSVINVPRPARSDLHPSQKPVELIERTLRNIARPGDIVVDPFGGSGSTMVAVDRLGMVARLIEITPEHADTIVRRWEMLTGRRAVHGTTGELFPADGEERQQGAAPSGDAF